MKKIYVTSDTHFNHNNIIEYCNRPFNSIEEMNETIIKNWNDTITNDDYVFFLGDFCLGNRENLIELGHKLNGHKILIMGNHDRVSATAFKDAGFETIHKKGVIVKFDEFDITIQFSHAPKYNDELVYPNVHGHVHDKAENDAMHFCACLEVNDYKPVLLDDIVKYFREQE